jgi:glycosyltransferase involved in cell wall biosynthesis
MKLSVVIPVYCVEATLDRCVKSVLRQHVDDMEVILVDDGSPDNCPKMCDRWSERDQRIRVVHKPNGGLSDARNAGIEIANGDYITFVDSDDWIADNTYPPLLDKMADIDILEFSIADRLLLKEHIYDDIHEYWLKEKAYSHTYACNKIYRRILFDDVRYPKGRVFEDAYTFPLLLQKAKKIATSSLGCYHYWNNPSGITAKADGHALAQLLEAHLSSKMPIDDLYYMHLVNIQIDVWELTGNGIIIPKRTVNISDLPDKYKFKALLLNTWGINNICKISRFIHHFKKPSRR